jgi:DnaK suppressor protein
MRYFTIEQREALSQALNVLAERLRDEVSADGKADLNEEPAAAEFLRDAAELRAVEEALARLHKPEFGLCAECGIEIPYRRLIVQPAATRCVRCEELHEMDLAGPHQAAL